MMLLPRASSEAAREYGGKYTRERIENLRRNCERYEWAKAQRDAATKNAQVWATRTDEELWGMIPGQALPRCIDTSWDYNKQPHQIGCLKCGSDIFKHGNYPWQIDFETKPWKITCPSCGSVFPTNDFGKYHASAIDERGLFNPAKGDRSLLFNTEHPDPADPLHEHGVDDGFGYTDSNGRTHKFVGYYAWKYWQRISYAISDLSTSYLYTGDKLYARKAAILLDRLADVYPDMDWKPYADMGWFHSDGSSHKGKIEGRIWETGRIKGFAESYDRILSGTVENADLYAFLKQQSERYTLPRPKGTRELLVANIDDNILRCGAEAIMAGRILGNEGMHESAMSTCAIALDTQPETSAWLDWIFSPAGGRIPGTIVGKIDRDGCGGEGAPGYSLIWNGQIGDLAARLEQYPAYAGHSVFRDFPQFARAYSAPWNLCVLGIATPNIGDSGSTGAIGRVACNPQVMASGYQYVKDPDIALAAFEANGRSARGLRGDIVEGDPESLGAEIARAARAGKAQTGTRNLTGFGLASLEYGSGQDGAALWLYYGRMDRHGHADRLNIGLYAFGVDLAPDLGYPEFAADWPHSSQWSNNTISHNTIVVDGQPQRTNLSGHSTLFASAPWVKALRVESPEIYPQTSAYDRTLLFVQAPGGTYGVDLFRVAGGSDHLLSFHGPPGEVGSSGLRLVKQETGTYAGESVPYGDTSQGHPPGYSFLYDVERDRAPSPSFWLDWKAHAGYRIVKDKDDLHLRWHVLTPCSEVALANGDPPQNKPGNPRRIRYALLHRTGADLRSTFASVLEPYRDRPFITEVTRLSFTPSVPGAVGIRVALADGAEDYILSVPGQQTIRTTRGISLTGGTAVLRVRGGEVQTAFLAGGSHLSHRSVTLNAAAAYTGTVARMDTDMQGDGEVWVSGDIPHARSIVGKQIIFENDRVLNACYTIRSAAREGDLWRISCGPVSFVRGYTDTQDYSKGYVYNFSEGARFTIPNYTTYSPDR